MSTDNKYIILQSSTRSGLREPFTGPRMSRVAPLARERFAPAINLSVETLSTRDIAEVRRSPDVVSIAPVMQVKLIAPLEIHEVKSMDGPGATWGVTATRAADSSYTGNGAVVAVLDTGIDENHEAFNGIQLVQEDFTGTGLGDLNGHGTHVAGTIFGKSNNGYRFGVAPGVKKAVIGKVFDESGSGTTDGIYRAILWAADQGANILSMSLGFSFLPVWEHYRNEGWPEDLALDRALEAYRANIRLFDSLAALIEDRAEIFNSTLLVAAAGNESKRDINPDYELTVAPPAAANGVVSVGALRTAGGAHDNLTVADFSNTGPDVVAPGVDVYSAKAGGGYISLSGTSMATPHVAGVAALWAERLLNETGYINSEALSARLIGQASRSSLAAEFDPFDVGEGLVQAPL